MFDKPFFVILTNRCNLTCPHCYNELDALKMTKTKAADPLSRDRLRYLFAELRRQGYEKAYFSGGEALLRADAPDVLGDAKAAGLKTALFTNGHVFTEPLVARLAEIGLGEVRISLNELAWIRNRKQYDLVFARQTQWIPALRAAGIGVGVIFIISARSAPYMEESLRRVRAMDAGMKVQPLYLPDHVKGFSEVSAACIETGEWDRLIGEIEQCVTTTDFAAEERFEVYGNTWKVLRYLYFVRDVYGLGARPDFCPTGPMLVVDSDGFFHPCLFRFDLVCGHVSSNEDVMNVRTTVDGHDELRSAPCFREECLSAYR